MKDNVCVAGVPMMNDAATLERYMPDIGMPVGFQLVAPHWAEETLARAGVAF